MAIVVLHLYGGGAAPVRRPMVWYGVRVVRWAARGPAAGQDRRPRRTLGRRLGGGPCGGAPRRRA
ncbi:hypothetical protein [Streptosporangium sp. NPDC006007]|uniref:hypothetical protein n=1 Tax=Streptosporangium sp. NPDC006007 TaxID=3154575 RepID=UPI0033B30FB2